MNNLLGHLGALAVQNPEWTRFILGAGIIIQGEITVLLSFYLIVNHNITLATFLSTALVTLIVVETFIYTLGKSMRNTRFGWKLYRKMKTNRKIQLYTYHLNRHAGIMFIIGKFLPGVNIALLFLMGWTKMAFKKFLRVWTVSIVIWLSITSLLAYFIMSGLRYLRMTHIFRDIEILIVGLIILIFGFEYLVKWLIQKFSPTELPQIDEEEK